MSKKKSYFVLFVIFLILSLVSIQNAKAHKPSSIGLFYNSTANILDVTINHEVSDPNSHYIATVEIEINGSTVLTESYTSQPNANAFTYHYNITANTNDRLEVTATCNQGGSFTACIIVGVGACRGVQIPRILGYFGLWIILGFSVIVYLFVIHRKIRYNKL